MIIIFIFYKIQLSLQSQIKQKKQTMKIYSIHMSEDGLGTNVYTNVKAMYNGILNLGGYTPISVTMVMETSPMYTFADLKFTYANLVKALRHSNLNNMRYEHVEILCEGGCCLQIEEHAIVSK